MPPDRRPHLLPLAAVSVLLAGLGCGWSGGPAVAEPLQLPTDGQTVRPAPLGGIQQRPLVRSERNAAYFNRPGAIPLSTFDEPPAQQGGATDAGSPGNRPAPRNRPGAIGVRATPAVEAGTARPIEARIQRPAPVAPQKFVERTRAVPGIIVRPVGSPPPAVAPRVFPAHPAQAARSAPIVAQPRSPAETLIETAETGGKLGLPPQAKPAPTQPGTILAPRPVGQGIRRVPIVPKPVSQTTGSLPTLPARPVSRLSPPGANQLATDPAALAAGSGKTRP